MLTPGRRLSGFIILSLLLFASVLALGETVRVTTFNIEWYGSGGTLPSKHRAEYRDRTIRAYLNAELRNSDVIIFQEIVNTARFFKNIIGNRMNCRTYYHTDRGHQHVVLCWKPHLRFDKERDDNNFKYEAIAINSNKSRPALSGVLKTRSGIPLAHFLGVHLKAYPEETGKRLTQTRALARRVNSFRDNLPVIIGGDFNTHVSELTGNKLDDYRLLDIIFARSGADLMHVYNPSRYTYRDPEKGHHLDHFWVSDSVRVVGRASSSFPCKGRVSQAQVEYYNQYVSDHCPVSVTLKLR